MNSRLGAQLRCDGPLQGSSLASFAQAEKCPFASGSIVRCYWTCRRPGMQRLAIWRGPDGVDKRKWAERGNTLPRFSAARGYRRGHIGASPQAALAPRREVGAGEGALASLHKRPISSCAAGLWIQLRPCKQSGSNLSSKATARQLANLPERASSRARACTRFRISLKSRLSCVMRASLARAWD